MPNEKQYLEAQIEMHEQRKLFAIDRCKKIRDEEDIEIKSLRGRIKNLKPSN